MFTRDTRELASSLHPDPRASVSHADFQILLMTQVLSGPLALLPGQVMTLTVLTILGVAQIESHGLERKKL